MKQDNNKKITIGLFGDSFFPMADGVIMVMDNYARRLCKYANVIVFVPEYLTKKEGILTQCKKFTENGMRVLLFGKVNGKIKDGELNFSSVKGYSLFILRDNIRPEVPKILKWFYKNKVDVKIISGDNLQTVQYIAKKAGVHNFEKAIDLSTISKDDDFEYIVLNNSIFARVTPE